MAAQHTHQQPPAAEHLAIVLGALQDLGIDARPAPQRSLAYVPRQLRQEGAHHG
jgi:hypothetical protein